MAISSVVNKNIYTGTDLVSEYNYSFKIFAQTELEVKVLEISTGTETDLVLTTDYTVSGVGQTAGGAITLVNASQDWLTGGFLKDEYKICIKRLRPLTQLTAVKNQGDYYPELHENQFDKLVMQDQQLKEQLDRSIRVPQFITSSDFDPQLPISVVGAANEYLVVNSDGDGFTTSAGVNTELPFVVGSTASPSAVVAATGISFSGSYWRNIWFIQGSGGAVSISADPRIAVGVNVGQRLMLVGCSNANYVDIQDSQGVRTFGQTIRHVNGTISEWLWDGTYWTLIATNGAL